MSRSRQPICPSWGARLEGIDGLRAIAAMTVLTGHAFYFSAPDRSVPTFGPLTNPIFYHLSNGLTLFFALSGFLLYRQFASAAILGQSRPSTGRYLRNRALRIFPAYWVILALIVVAGAEMTASVYETGPLDTRGLVANVFLVQNLYPSGVGTGITAAWSLTVELTFYLLLPLMGLLTWHAAQRRSFKARVAIVIAPAAALLALGVAFKLVAIATINPGRSQAEQWGTTWHAVLERSFLCSADLFAFGMVAAVATVLLDHRQLPRWQLVSPLAGVAAVVVWGLATTATDRGIIDDRFYRTAIAAASGLLIYFVATPVPQLSVVRRFLEWRPIAWLGVTSYSIYLVHFRLSAGSGTTA